MSTWDFQIKGTLVVIGQGYVGLPVAMRAVEVGYRVVGLDTDTVRVWALQDGRSFVDDVSDAQLQAALATGRYLASTAYSDAAGFDAAIITVPTPLKDGYPDLTFIEDAARALAPQVRRGSTVILESTSYPGTTEEILIPLLERGSGLRAGQDFAVGYSPERIDPGNPRFTFVNTPKVVSGIDPESLAAVQHLYADLVETTVPVSSPKEAELTKLLENTFRHVNIALVNELAVLAHQLGVDIWEVISAASTKPFGYMRFTPGPGVGGHCLPVDPTYLSWVVQRDLHRTFKFVDLANDINDHMPDYVVARLTTLLNNDCKPMRNSTVLLLGLAYKPNTGDIRESPALRIIELLGDAGANIEAVDTHIEPHRAPTGVKLVDLTEQTLRRADVVVLITDHSDVDYDLVTTHARAIFDTRHRLLGNVEYL
jgi:UDP-N-acetyl-D-mannosaminuronic acid dehydrogenase/UDP-N-acetyl-D-glucosamine dehydrogenase